MDPVLSLLEMVTLKENTFQDVGYFVSGKVHPKLLEMLDAGGGRQKAYPTIGVTHFIAGEGADRDLMDEAKDIFEIPIVSPRWISFSVHNGKALPASWFLAEGKELFAGLTFAASGLREKDLLTAWSVVTFHNGVFLRHLTKACTHLICNETTSRKYAAAKQMNLPVVCVDWLTDSIKQGIRLNEKPYDPRLITITQSQQPTPKQASQSQPIGGLISQVPPPAPIGGKPPRPRIKAPKAKPNPPVELNQQLPKWVKKAIQPKPKRNNFPPVSPLTPQSKPVQTAHVNGMDRVSAPAATTANPEQRIKTVLAPAPSPAPAEEPHLPLGPPSSSTPSTSTSSQGHTGQTQPGQSQTVLVIRRPSGSESSKFPPVSCESRVPPGGTGAVDPNVNSTHSDTRVNLGGSESRLNQQQYDETQPKDPPPPPQQQLQQQQQQQQHQHRAAASVEQLEIIQMIQNDPQIKLQWAHMDHTQRMLLVQKLAQKNREERLRKEMMLKQQQMHMNSPQVQGHSSVGNVSVASVTSGQDTPLSTQAQTPMRQIQLAQVPTSPFQNHDARPNFTGAQAQVATALPRQPLMAEDFGKDVALMEAQTQLKQQQGLYYPQDSGQNSGQSSPQQTIFFTRAANIGTPLQQHRLLVTQHQAGATIRSEHSQSNAQSFTSSPPDDSLQRIITPQLPQTPNQKVQAYLQNSIIPMQQQQQQLQEQQQHQQQQQQQMVAALGAAQFYGHVNSTTADTHAMPVTTTSPQKIQNVRPSPAGQHPSLVLDPQQASPQGQGHVNWSPTSSSSPGSFNSLTNSPQQAQQRLVSPTGVGMTRQSRPQSDTQQHQQQQWTATALRGQPPQIIYTTQANMPYSPQVMNQKTKTALANLLSNRLMGSTTPDAPQGQPQGGTTVQSRSPSPLAPPPPPPPATNLNMSTVQSRVPTGVSGKQPPHALQRRTLSNLTNSDKSPTLTQNNVMVPMVTPQAPSPSYSTPSARFFGHDPNLKLPEGGFLLGCVFWAAQELRIPNWYKFVLKFGGEVETTYSNKVTHVLAETQKFPEFQQCVRDRKRLVTLFWLNDTIARRCLTSPSQAVHLPLPFTEGERPYFGELVSTSGFSCEEKERVQVMCTLLGLVITPVFTRANIGLIAKSPEGEKFLKAREWRKPVVNIQFLNELLFGHTGVIPMIHSPKYQQFNMGAPFSFDVALVAPLMAPWKTPLRVGNDAIQKFLSKPSYPALESPQQYFHAAKRLKLDMDVMFPATSPIPPPETPPPLSDGLPEAAEMKPPVPASSGVAVMLSGFPDSMKDVMKTKIEELGGRVTNDRHVATHLIAMEGVVTKTLVTFLCIKDTIVGIDWLRYSWAQKKFIGVDDYLFTSGTCGETRIDYSAIFKMPNRHRLFAGLVFFVTPSVGKDVREMIEAAGGKIVTEKVMHKVYESAMKNLESYVIVTCEDDEYLLSCWKDRDNVDKIIVVTRDTILMWILQQNTWKESKCFSKSETIVQTATVTSSAAEEFPSVLDGIGGEDPPGGVSDKIKMESVPMELA